MSTEKNKALQDEKKRNQDVVETEANQQGTLFGTLIRGVLILALLFFMLKPYLFDKAKEESGVPQVFVVQGSTMGTNWSARVCASPEQIVAVNEQFNAQVETSEKEKGVEKSSEVVAEAEDDQVASCEGLLSRVIQRELDKVDALASTYRADSEVSRFNRSNSIEWFPTSLETAEIVSRALDVSEKTNGAFDVTVAPLVNMYRFGPNKTPLTAFPTDEDLAKVKENVGYKKLSVRLEPEPGICKSNPALTIDLSGVAKGYAADLVGRALEGYGLKDYMIEIGGEIRCAGTKVDSTTFERLPWVLGIQKPEVFADTTSRENAVPDVYRILNFELSETSGAMATSGDYQNFLQIGDLRFSHIVDPRTGKPTELLDGAVTDEPSERLGSVSVVSTSTGLLSCADADALATAFFVLGEKEGIALANKLNVAVLYLFRSDDSAIQLREVASEAFKSLDCRLADVPDGSEPAASASNEERLEKSEKAEK